MPDTIPHPIPTLHLPGPSGRAYCGARGPGIILCIHPACLDDVAATLLCWDCAEAFQDDATHGPN